MSCVSLNYPMGTHRQHTQLANVCRTGWVLSVYKKAMRVGFQINFSVIRKHLCLMWIDSKSLWITSVSVDEDNSKRVYLSPFLFENQSFWDNELCILIVWGSFLILRLCFIYLQITSTKKPHRYPLCKKCLLQTPCKNPILDGFYFFLCLSTSFFKTLSPRKWHPWTAFQKAELQMEANRAAGAVYLHPLGTC